MTFIDIPVEQTTAVTDLLVAAMGLGCILLLRAIPVSDRHKSTIWQWIFGLMMFVGVLGAIIHGLQMAEATRSRLWIPTLLALGLLVSFIFVAALHDLGGQAKSRRALPWALAAGVGFFIIAMIWPAGFWMVIAYELVATLFALGIYLYLSVRGRLAGGWWMVAGVVATIVAAGAQASGAIQFTLIWEFDSNGAFHLIQMLAILFLIAGLRQSLKAG